MTETVVLTITADEAAALEGAAGDGRKAAQIINDDLAKRQLEIVRKERNEKWRRLSDKVQGEIMAIYHPDPVPPLP